MCVGSIFSHSPGRKVTPAALPSPGMVPCPLPAPRPRPPPRLVVLLRLRSLPRPRPLLSLRRTPRPRLALSVGPTPPPPLVVPRPRRCARAAPRAAVVARVGRSGDVGMESSSEVSLSVGSSRRCLGELGCSELDYCKGIQTFICIM